MTYLPLLSIKILFSGEFLDIIKIIERLVIRVEVGNLPVFMSFQFVQKFVILTSLIRFNYESQYYKNLSIKFKSTLNSNPIRN